MVSNSRSSDPPKLRASDVSGILISKINELRRQIQAERAVTIKEKVKKNREKLENLVSQHVSSAVRETGGSPMGSTGMGRMLSSRIENPLCILGGPAPGLGDRDHEHALEVAVPMCAKLQSVDHQIPPYTTWSFLSKNQRMAEDQSVSGRHQIYYLREEGSEALISSDSEEETADPEEEKHEFSEEEDRILRMVSREFELSHEVLNILTQFIGGSTSEIKERCAKLKKSIEDVTSTAEDTHDRSINLEKSLSASLDSLDNLFCRRCLVFDCRLHGCSQNLIFPSEKHFYPSESAEDAMPCGDHCFLRLQDVNKCPESTAIGTFGRTERKTSEEEWRCEVSLKSGKRKISKETSSLPDCSIQVLDNHEGSSRKKQNIFCRPDTVATVVELPMTSTNEALRLVEGHAEGIQSSCQWKPLEKELYLKGVEIFGRNSCLIARNLLSGLKTCIEVSNYMYDRESALSERCSTEGPLLGDEIAVGDPMEPEMPARSRLLRRRGRARRLKYSSKSAGHPAIWRRIAHGKNPPCRQYTPCGCQPFCGKECPCLENRTCCEKFCGCSKSCKNRFRGCHCAKSQCRSRQCPCFAAGRECDPDVCRNCWVSCGDGSLGEPPKRGDGQCGNMRLLLRQQQRILLAKSDVAGWGAFLKNSVNKNDYLGEYTGELISHQEADKRGKIYDRTNSSFLFNLNDQYCLDACRKGDKLKFANHSVKPNCYARVMLVSGDHRVGIFAKDRIEAGEELFYDYHYEQDQKPVWAKKLDSSKGEESSASKGRAKKHQSQR